MDIKYKYYQNRSDFTVQEKTGNQRILDSIPELHSIEFFFQLEKGFICFTQSSMVFEFQNKVITLPFNEISKLKITGDLTLEIRKNDENWPFSFPDVISKGKIYTLLSQLSTGKLDHCSHLKANDVFNSSTTVRLPEKQNQHVIPEVYLKNFGFEKNGQWKVRVIQRTEKFQRTKSIGSFLSKTNHYDIETDDDRIVRIIEQLNGELETQIPRIIAEIEKGKNISFESRAYLYQITANFMSRSDFWRDFIKDTLESEYKIPFVKGILIHTCKNNDEFKEIESSSLFKQIVLEKNESSVNRALLLFMSSILDRITYFSVVALMSPENKPWFTSDNPVLFKSHHGSDNPGLISKDSEFFFPLTPSILIYFHLDKSNQESSLRKLKNGTIINIDEVLSDKEHMNLSQQITRNAYHWVISPMDLSKSFNRLANEE